MSCVQLPNHHLQQPPSHFSSLSRTVDQLLSESEEDVYPEVVASLSSTLKRLMLWFIYHGDQISAAGCFVLLQNAYSLLNQSENLLNAVVDFLSIASKFDDLVLPFFDHFDTLSSSESNDLQDVPIRRCLTLTSQVFGNPSAICPVTPELSKLLCQLCEYLDADTSTTHENTKDADTIDSTMAAQITLGIQRRVLVTTMLMLNSKICIDAGKPSTAVVYLGWCRIQCREFVRWLRFARRCLKSLILDDMAVQVDDMLTMCYERLARAFCLLGIRRKAEDHALLSVLKQQILSSKSFHQVEIQDLIYLIDRHDGHEGFLQLIRSLMKVTSLSLSPDTIASHLIAINNVGSKFNVDLHDNLYRILCKTENALACEFWHCSLCHYHSFSRAYIWPLPNLFS